MSSLAVCFSAFFDSFYFEQGHILRRDMPTFSFLYLHHRILLILEKRLQIYTKPGIGISGKSPKLMVGRLIIDMVNMHNTPTLFYLNNWFPYGFTSLYTDGWGSISEHIYSYDKYGDELLMFIMKMIHIFKY